MAGFLRKVAGAFIELPEEAAPAPADAPEPSHDEVADLLDQLDPGRARASEGRESPQAPRGSAPSTAPSPRTPAAPPPVPVNDDVLALTADEVFAAAGIEEGANSANRLRKMLAGLAMFPPDQQLAMVRALDSADSSWTEGGVLADARVRQQALRAHLDRVEREHARRVATLGDRGREAQSKGDSVIAEIDSQMAELQRLRQDALTETAQAIASLDTERRDADTALASARKSVTEVSDVLANLIAFFAGKPPPPNA